MTFLTRLMRRLFARAPVPASAAPPPEPAPTGFDRLATQAALIDHLEWCVAFHEHLRTDPTSTTPHAPLPGPAESGLGRWLAQAMASRAEPQPRLEALQAEYQQFHHLASQALSLAQAGQIHLASTLLNTDFERSRARVLQMLRTLQRS
jgi:hypothetical protein